MKIISFALMNRVNLEKNYINALYDVDFLINSRKVTLFMFHINMCGYGHTCLPILGLLLGVTVK